MKRSYTVLILAFCLASCSSSHPPSDAQVQQAVEDHVRRLVGNEFRRVTILDMKRQEPVEQYVPELGKKAMTYPVTFALRIDTTRGQIDDPTNTTTFYLNNGKWVAMQTKSGGEKTGK